MIELKIDNRGIKELMKTHPHKVSNFLGAVGLQTINNWKLGMQGTPRSSVGKRKRKGDDAKHYPSLPGNPPAREDGNLMDSLKFEVKGNEIHFNGMAYGLILNDTSSAGKNRPFIEPGIQDVNAQSLAKRYLS